MKKIQSLKPVELVFVKGVIGYRKLVDFESENAKSFLVIKILSGFLVFL